MRGKIKLDGRKHLANNEGFPIVFYLTKYKKEKTILTGYRSKKEHWDKANSLPTKKHPDYVDLINYLEDKKITLRKLLNQAKQSPITLDDAERILKGYDGEIFHKMGMEVKGSRTYKIALNSFNTYFPDYTFSAITPKIARDYMEILSTIPVNGKQRSPNGIISYMNTLTAIWNKLGKPDNPFSGIRPRARKTKSKALTKEDLIKIRDNDYEVHANSKGGGIANYLDYFMLCFYLGGIDLGDLVKMRYDRNVINGRLEFRRSKGGSDVFVSNLIFPVAWELLDKFDKFDCKPYLIPLAMQSKYNNFIPNISRVLPKIKEELNLSRLPYSKSARYTFINQSRNLLIDRRICEEIVGHSDSSTHSIYEDNFPYHVRDEAHGRVIDVGGG